MYIYEKKLRLLFFKISKTSCDELFIQYPLLVDILDNIRESCRYTG
jgi:hypothetical protein